MDLQDKLEMTVEIAREELKKAKVRDRKGYDKNVKGCTFQVGDEVLLLLPTDENKIIMQWKGPFKAVKRSTN